MINFYDINIYFIFCLGTILGSFLNVLIYRLPRNISFAKGRSKCPHCGETIHWYDLIPLISYIMLGGKCRKCKDKISIQYPLVEFFTGLMFLLLYSLLIQIYGRLYYLHIILFIIILCFTVGIFTDFLYQGAFNFSTIYLAGIYFVYRLLETKNLKFTCLLALKSLVYLVPIIFIAIYYNFKIKKKYILSILTLVLFTLISFYSLLYINLNVNVHIFTFIINWFPLCLLIIIADYIIKKITKNSKIINMISTLLNWINFIAFFLFLFSQKDGILNVSVYKNTFVLSIKNVIIVILFSLFYLFMEELFNSHDNNEDIIYADDELIKRDENIFTSYIGDGDILTLPFVGMVLGYENVIVFYSILAFSIIAVYCLIFRKGLKYVIPMYPFIILSIFTIFII